MPVPPIATKCTRRGVSLTPASWSSLAFGSLRETCRSLRFARLRLARRRLREEALHHEVVHDRAQLEAALLRHLMHAVGEHHHHRLAIEIDPQRSPREAEVPDRARREVLARRGLPRRRRVPAERPVRSLRQLLAFAEGLERRAWQR